MGKRKKQSQPPRQNIVFMPEKYSALFQAWREAAQRWRELPSGARLAPCVAARRDWYLDATGAEPPALRLTDEWEA